MVQRLGIAFDGVFGRGIERPIRHGQEAEHGADVDDATSAVSSHLGHHSPRHPDDAEEIRIEDVLGHSLEETAETMGSTVMAVKAALVRGRRQLLDDESAAAAEKAPSRADLDRYAALFNASDWDGVRALVSADCRLDLVSKSQRHGKQVGMYFARYEKEPLTARVLRVDGQLALGVYAAGAADKPAYFILLEHEAGKVTRIRDFRYVPYIAAEAEIEPV